jgi:hypothetical protein
MKATFIEKYCELEKLNEHLIKKNSDIAKHQNQL